MFPGYPDYITPDEANTAGLDPRSIQAALARMTPEQRAMMFEPFSEEIGAMGARAAPQHHTSALGGLFGGLSSGIGSVGEALAMRRMQQNAQAMFGAAYGGDPRAAMVNALRQRQQPALEADPYAPPADYSEA